MALRANVPIRHTKLPIVTDHKIMHITVRYEFSVVIGAILWILGWFSLANVWNIPRINAWSSQSPWPHGSLVFFLANIFWIAGIIICGALGPVTVLNYLTTLKLRAKKFSKQGGWASINRGIRLTTS